MGNYDKNGGKFKVMSTVPRFIFSETIFCKIKTKRVSSKSKFGECSVFSILCCQISEKVWEKLHLEFG